MEGPGGRGKSTSRRGKLLPVAEPQTEGIGDLIESPVKDGLGGIAAIERDPVAELELADIRDLPGIEVEVVVGLLFAFGAALEFLPRRIPVAKAGACAEAKRMPAMRSEIEVQHHGNGDKVFRQLILGIIDGIHDHPCRIGEETDIVLIPVVVELDADTIFQVHDMFDEVEPLHKDPDVYIHRFAVVELEPVLAAAWCELLGRGGGINGLVVVVGEAEVEDAPRRADIGRPVAAAVVAPALDAYIGVGGTLFRAVADDQQITDPKGVAARMPVVLFACGIGLRVSENCNT
jgi:hypothetical protein